MVRYTLYVWLLYCACTVGLPRFTVRARLRGSRIAFAPRFVTVYTGSGLPPPAAFLHTTHHHTPRTWFTCAVLLFFLLSGCACCRVLVWFCAVCARLRGSTTVPFGYRILLRFACARARHRFWVWLQFTHSFLRTLFTAAHVWFTACLVTATHTTGSLPADSTTHCPTGSRSVRLVCVHAFGSGLHHRHSSFTYHRGLPYRFTVTPGWFTARYTVYGSRVPGLRFILPHVRLLHVTTHAFYGSAFRLVLWFGYTTGRLRSRHTVLPSRFAFTRFSPVTVWLFGLFTLPHTFPHHTCHFAGFTFTCHGSRWFCHLRLPLVVTGFTHRTVHLTFGRYATPRLVARFAGWFYAPPTFAYVLRTRSAYHVRFRAAAVCGCAVCCVLYAVGPHHVATRVCAHFCILHRFTVAILPRIYLDLPLRSRYTPRSLPTSAVFAVYFTVYTAVLTFCHWVLGCAVRLFVAAHFFTTMGCTCTLRSVRICRLPRTVHARSAPRARSTVGLLVGFRITAVLIHTGYAFVVPRHLFFFFFWVLLPFRLHHLRSLPPPTPLPARLQFTVLHAPHGLCLRGSPPDSLPVRRIYIYTARYWLPVAGSFAPRIHFRFTVGSFCHHRSAPPPHRLPHTTTTLPVLYPSFTAYFHVGFTHWFAIYWFTFCVYRFPARFAYAAFCTLTVTFCIYRTHYIPPHILLGSTTHTPRLPHVYWLPTAVAFTHTGLRTPFWLRVCYTPAPAVTRLYAAVLCVLHRLLFTVTLRLLPAVPHLAFGLPVRLWILVTLRFTVHTAPLLRTHALGYLPRLPAVLRTRYCVLYHIARFATPRFAAHTAVHHIFWFATV